VTLERRAATVEVEDRYQLTQWKEPLRLSLMTPLRVDITRPGEVQLRASQEQGGGRYLLAYDARLLRVAAEDIEISDAQLRSMWGERLGRLVLTTQGSALEGGYRVVLRAEQ